MMTFAAQKPPESWQRFSCAAALQIRPFPELPS